MKKEYKFGMTNDGVPLCPFCHKTDKVGTIGTGYVCSRCNHQFTMSSLTLAKINEEARKEGLSYGQYVGKYGI